MAEVEIEKKGPIFIVTLNNSLKGNALNKESLSAHRTVLTKLESVKENSAVIVTSIDPKSWCVGLDLKWIESQTKKEFEKTYKDLEDIFGRWAMLPLPTIACITGHCMAGGAILASTMDFRIMRADRGWFAFTEIDVKIALSPILYDIADLLTEKHVLRDLLLTGKRIGGVDAQKLGVVDESHLLEELMPRAYEIATELSQKDLKTYKTMKQLLKQNLFHKLKNNSKN